MPLKLVVCVKQVPATESKLAIVEGRDIDRSTLGYVLNPYDEFAVEEALQIKDRLGADVTVLSLRPFPGQKVEDSLRTCLAMGADKAVLLADSAFEHGDGLTTALVLAAALRQLPFDLILCGKQAVDDDGAAVGIQLAELLGVPHAGVVNKLELAADGKSAVAHRQIEGGLEVVDLPLPALITCQKGLNEPRYPSLPGIMKAKQKPLEVWDRTRVDVPASELGARSVLVRLEPPPTRPTGRILSGEAATTVAELIRLLREEAKVL